MPDNIFILIHLKMFKFDQELLKYVSCSLSISFCSPKCSPNLHHRRLIFQQGDLCFSLHVSLFGWNIKFSTCTFFGYFFPNPYPWSHIVNLYWFQNSDGFPFWKKKRKKKESYFLFHHEYWLEPNFFVGHSLYSRDFLSRSIKSIIWKERKP